jgi:hypothetical protein
MFFTGLQQCPGRFRMRPDLLMKWPTGSGSVIQDYGFADPDPKENINRSTTLSSRKEKNLGAVILFWIRIYGALPVRT